MVYANTNIEKYVRSHIWNNINSIVRTKKLTLLYREEFTASDIDALHAKLRDSWSKISIEELGNDTDGKMILINLEQ